MRVLSSSTDKVISRPPTEQWGRSKNLIDLIPQMVCAFDDNGQLLEVNEPFRKATGLECGTFAPWARLLGSEEAWRFQTTWLAASQSNEAFEFESRLAGDFPANGIFCLFQFQPDGTPRQDRRWYGSLTELKHREPIRREIDGINDQLNNRLVPRPAAITAYAAPPTKGGGSLEKYRRRSELLSELLDSLLEGVVLLDSGGIVQLANDAARSILGPELLGLAAHEWHKLNLIRKFDRTPVTLAELPITKALRGEESPELELWLSTDEGVRRRCEMRATPFCDHDGQVRGAVMVCRDVTERRRMEEQLGYLQKLEAIGHLSAGIAHEINTPLQYVGDNLRFLVEAFGELLGDRDEKDFLAKEIPQAISQSIEGVDHVAGIVRAMKEFAGTGPEEAMVVSVNRVVENVVAVTRNVWKFGVDVRLELDPSLAAIPGYPRELNQAAYHLFMNAVESVRETPESTGVVVLRTRNLANGVELSIADSGPGIPDEIRPHVFNPFFTTKAPGRHSGQGLTHVLAAVVQRHRGSVELEKSEIGGAKMVVRLPREW